MTGNKQVDKHRWKMNSWLQVCLCLHIDAAAAAAEVRRVRR